MADPGDLIEIERVHSITGMTFYHWAVFVGHGCVIDATTNGTSSSAAFISDTATVRKGKLTDVAAGDTWKVKNSLDKKYKPKHPDVILKEAEQNVGKVLPYSLLGKNCEHFATNLRYGVPESRQAQVAIETAAFSGASLSIIGVLAMNAMNSHRNQVNH